MAQSLHIGVLYNAPQLPCDHADAASEAGILESVAAFEKSLCTAGHKVTCIAAQRSAAALARQLEELRPNVVVNLCESFAGNSAGEPHIAALLELLGIAYTGSPPACLALTRNKAQTKRLLLGAEAPTAPFVELAPHESPPDSLRTWLEQAPLFIKPAGEDASLGIAQQSVVTDWSALEQQVQAVQTRYGTVLVERYVAGREFNVGIVELPALQVLPLAEIEFQNLPDAPWPIVTYDAKWNADSAADRATPVRCPANVSPALAEKIISAATKAYRLTGCRDYARIDLRVDPQQDVFVLEVNANPDLSPTAGLARMLKAAGIDDGQFASRLVQTALQRCNIKTALLNKKCDPLQKNSANIRSLAPTDHQNLLSITRDTNVFRPDELEIADELLRQSLREGRTGHYQVLVAESNRQPIAWACFGRVPMTDATFDLYWIVVAPSAQHQGLGRRLLDEVESHVRAAGARWLLAETSSIAIYDPTRVFYRRCGYSLLGEIPDFYRPADGKITFGKRLDCP